jgi:4-amino-4-deoxy-L-arabinose transferase-like glycosyltransferase
LLVLLPAAFGMWRGWSPFDARRGPLLRDRRAWFGPLAFVAAASLWLVPMITSALSHPDPAYRAYLDDILFRQTAVRYTKSWDHAQPWWYHLGVMATVWLPTVLALPWALPAWRRRLRRRDARYLLPLAWWAMLVVFFSIPSGKRDVYILPALPMMCLALAPLLPGIVRKAWAKRIAFAFGLALALLVFVVGIAIWAGEPHLSAKLTVDRGFNDGGRAAAALLLAIGAWGLAALSWHRVRDGVRGLLWMLGGTWVLYGLVAHPLLNPSSSAAGVMSAAQQRIGAHGQLGLVAWKEQNLLMSEPTAANFGFRAPWTTQLQRGIDWQAQDPGRRWLFVQETALTQCVDRARAEFVGYSNRRRWWLVPAAAVVPGCIPQGIESQNEADEQD